MTELEYLYLAASSLSFTRIHGKLKKILYCTKDVYEYLKNIDSLFLWDEIDTELLSEQDTIDRFSFFAAAKIKIIKKIESPFIMIDNDLFFKCERFNLQDLEKNDIIVNYHEIGAGYYMNAKDFVLKKSGIKNFFPPDPNRNAYNVSFLYIKNEYFRKEYSEISYDWMEKISAVGGGHGGHMIFCEQKLLYDLCKKYSLDVKTLIPYKYNCLSKKYVYNEDIDEHPCICINHLGDGKIKVIEDENWGFLMRKEAIDEIIKSPDYKKVFLCANKMKQILNSYENN